MTAYSIALFLHTVGALGLVVALGLEWTSLSRLRRATTAEQAREWLNLYAPLRVVGPSSLLSILLPGLYMTATEWGWAPWIVVGLTAMLLLLPLGAASGLRIASIGREIGPSSGPLSGDLQHRIRDPIASVSLQTRVAMVVGIVFLMSVKPDWAGSVITLAVSVLIGLASAWPLQASRRPGVSAA